MYERLIKKMTMPVRLMMGGVLLLIGVVWQVLSGKILDMYAFYIMAAAMLCFVQVIMCRLSKGSVDPIRYILLNMIVLITGFVLTESDRMEGVVLYTVWGICLIVDGIVNALLLKCDGVAKRVVMGVVAMVFHVVLIGIVFMVPVLAAAFGKR